MKITMANKETKEKLVLTFDEFRKKFKTEFEHAYNKFINQENMKNIYVPPFMKKQLSENDFLLNLSWNFNNYSDSKWYILYIR